MCSTSRKQLITVLSIIATIRIAVTLARPVMDVYHPQTRRRLSPRILATLTIKLTQRLDLSDLVLQHGFFFYARCAPP